VKGQEEFNSNLLAEKEKGKEGIKEPVI